MNRIKYVVRINLKLPVFKNFSFESTTKLDSAKFEVTDYVEMGFLLRIKESSSVKRSMKKISYKVSYGELQSY